MKKKSLGKLVIFSVLFIVILVMAALTVCAALALKDNKDKYTLAKTDDSFLDTALKNALTGSEFHITEDQLNTYLNNKYCSDTDENSLKNIRIYFHSDDDIELYAGIRHWNHDFSLYAKAKTELNPVTGIASVQIYNAKIGELSIPDFILNKIITNFADNQKYVTFENNILYIQTLYQYEFETFTITLNLEKFEPKDGGVNCKTNSLTIEALKALKDYLFSEKGQAMCKRIFGYNVSDLKKDLLSAVFG